jgi:hypothetical protein
VVSTCSYGAAGGVDVEVDWFLRVVGFEEEELGDDGGGHGLVDFAIEADDALLWWLLVRVYGAGIADSISPSGAARKYHLLVGAEADC